MIKENLATVMPDPLDLGQHHNSPISVALYNYQDKIRDNKYCYLTVMGFFLPPWQRGLVWTE